jgi:putative MATE family efflux protein
VSFIQNKKKIKLHSREVPVSPLQSTAPEQNPPLFSKKRIWQLLIPLMIEQVLTSLMGTADTMMVSNISSAAISAVSLVDAINVLIIYIFSAMATGGSIICAQYLGRKDRDAANETGKQLILSVSFISIVVTLTCVLLRRQLLHLIFGRVEADVMENAIIYFLITALSYPFIALYNAGAALFRVDGNSRLPMTVSTLCNLVNIAGNAILIFCFHMGVAGAALATLVSRILCAVIVLYCLHNPQHTISVQNYRKIRPDAALIRRILAVGIPTGIENGMFQFGKLAVQSTVSTLGTTAIAAQAMTAVLELLASNPQLGIGLGMMTIVGQLIGAGQLEEARRNIKRLTGYAEVTTILCCLIIALAIKPVTVLGGMETDAAALAIHLIHVIALFKPLTWTLSFLPAYGMRAAGDVRYSMVVSSLSMWICRVGVAAVLVRVFHFGVIAVWIGMFTDWSVRAIFFTVRFLNGKWAKHSVLES